MEKDELPAERQKPYPDDPAGLSPDVKTVDPNAPSHDKPADRDQKPKG